MKIYRVVLTNFPGEECDSRLYADKAKAVSFAKWLIHEFCEGTARECPIDKIRMKGAENNWCGRYTFYTPDGYEYETIYIEVKSTFDDVPDNKDIEEKTAKTKRTHVFMDKEVVDELRSFYTFLEDTLEEYDSVLCEIRDGGQWMEFFPRDRESSDYKEILLRDLVKQIIENKGKIDTANS